MCWEISEQLKAAIREFEEEAVSKLVEEALEAQLSPLEITLEKDYESAEVHG